MSDRRSNTRFKALGGLHTPFGEVIDISNSGLGVFRKGNPALAIGDTVKLYLSNATTEVQLSATVVRVDPAGLFRHEIGFAFIDADEQTLSKVWALADNACSEFVGPKCWVAA